MYGLKGTDQADLNTQLNNISDETGVAKVTPVLRTVNYNLFTIH